MSLPLKPLPFERIAKPSTGDWPTYHGQLTGNRHSTLAEITPANVGTLAMRWMFTAPNAGVLQVTPVVVDGTMYVTNVNACYALDAVSGKLLWQYRRDRTKGLAGDAASGINRGVALLENRLFMVTDNAHLIALDRSSGSVLWEITMADSVKITAPHRLRWLWAISLFPESPAEMRACAAFSLLLM